MELRQLQCLVECAKTQSFSQAAALLFTTQSNVSKMISSLEDELGQKLFERKQRGIILTEKGRQIYHHALSVLECANNITECAKQKDAEELRVSFQHSNWLAAAFCDFFIANHKPERRYFLKNTTVDGIIRRLSNNMDQLGLAYIEETQLMKLQDTLKANHIGYTVLKQMDLVCCYGEYAGSEEDLAELPLIQNFDDVYSGLSMWKDKLEHLLSNVIITTDSESVFREILQRTKLSTIGAAYPSHEERALSQQTCSLLQNEASIQYICLYRDDRKLDVLPQEFLNFVRKYICE